ncbi:MAG TPA: FtsW/RodA/SpoVE family cell cycle protein [Anaerolineae bacterium]|nr:FtsW/RodA/SpoVE family cell cycle protein [Anaerolineae bacterium]HQH38398.1 FtsW/RodA/SpoVE family cell cycle protein [Anaerolineae bacterium]
MSTQPVRQRWRAPALRQMRGLLVGIPAGFVILGAVTLYFAAPTPALTPWHLVALVLGWSLAWGASYALLRHKLPGADPFILPLVSLLTGWGLLLLARLAPSFLLRQILWLGVSCGALCGVALVPTLPRLLRRYRYTLLAGGLLLLGATFFFGVNPSGYGQQLWLGGFGIYFQPSELLKLLLVIYLASYLSDRRDMEQQKAGGRALWMATLGPMLTMVGLALLLLGWQQDLGGALLFYLTFVAMLYLAWGKGWHVAVSLLLFVPVAVAGYMLSDRVALRVSIWLNPWTPEQADRAFQILQSLFALAAGGLFGEGLGQGMPTLIPAVHTDFVYAALVEEFGLTGAVGLIILLGLLIDRGIVLAQKATAPFESLLAGGIAALFAIQTWVIAGGNAKLIPITGVTLPFLSYGGSSLLTMFVATGLLLNISAPHPEPLTLSLAASNTLPLRKTAGRLGRALLLLLTSVVLTTGVWSVLRADELRHYLTNPRRILAESRIQRGRILDRNGVRLADITVDAAGYVTRTYPIPEAAPVVGYTTLQYGGAGIEAACEARLRGEIERTPWQNIQARLLHQDPVGREVRLTIDARLQRTAQQLLQDYQGAAVLVDARTGEILALAASPIYDSATVEEDWESLYNAPDAPLLNRATQGLAQPGAILQTVWLEAALQENIFPDPAQPITAPVSVNGETLTCAQIPTDATWQAALTAGCPAPFAALGTQLGMARLAESLTRWGLTDAPALEIPTVAATWDSAGADVLREVVGQGNLLVTPLQMVSVAATVGNGGIRVPLQLLAQPLSGCSAPAVTPNVRVTTPEIAARIVDLWPRYGETVGHIGDALAGPNRTQTWFIGLNSARVPRYAVAVLIENAPQRYIPAQIARQLLEQAVNP